VPSARADPKRLPWRPAIVLPRVDDAVGYKQRPVTSDRTI
jgi:hypothetical protein